MNPILRNILVVIGAYLAGSIVNIALVNLGPYIIPLPEGADVSDMEKLAESMQLFTPMNFLFPFLGHAIGTFVGAYVAARFATSHQLFFASGIGVLFELGGISAVVMLGGPLWFTIVDLSLAYIPMAFLAALLAGAFKPKTEEAS